MLISLKNGKLTDTHIDLTSKQKKTHLIKNGAEKFSVFDYTLFVVCLMCDV